MLHHPHLHPLTHDLSQQCTFTSIQQHPGGVTTGSRDRNVNSTPHRTQVCSGTAFHRATQKSLSTKERQARGRWGALHVCIAWKIHYHKQLKRQQENPSGRHGERLTLDGPISSGQHKEELPCPTHSYQHSQCGISVHGDIRDQSEVGKAPSSMSRRHPPDPHTLSAGETKKAIATAGSQRSALIPDLDGGCRKRPLACDGVEKAKRAKQQVTECHPSHFIATRSFLSTQHTVYPGGGGYGVTYPGDLHYYRTASWEPQWNTAKRLQLHAGLNIPKDVSLNACKAARAQFAAERQRKEAFLTPSDCYPVAMRSLSPLQGSAPSCWPSGRIQSGSAGF